VAVTIRLTELNFRTGDPDRVREIAAEPPTIVCYRQNTIILWILTCGYQCSTLTSLQRKRYLFVCVNRRAEDNPKGCCAAKDSEEVYRALKGEVAARGLAKLEARVCTSSCLDQCATGVTVLVEPDHFFYGRVKVADVQEIVDGIVSNRRVERLVLTADDLEKA
jgi:(2Fe-2S) ferredoxin